MIIEIPNQIISQSGLSSKEILLKVALMLFQEERLTPLTGEQTCGFASLWISERVGFIYPEGIDDGWTQNKSDRK